MNLLTLSTILVSILVAAGEDITAYVNARSKWAANKIEFEEPIFDWRLFHARLCLGFIRGALVGLGVNTVDTLTPGGL